MRVTQGCSASSDAARAVEEATAGWTGDHDLVIAFCSTAQDPAAVACALRERLGDVPIIGCTTAGEHLGERHYNGHLVLMGLETPRVKWATAAARDLSRFGEADARKLSDELLAALGVSRDEVNPQRHFCLLFIDGLSCKEEVVSSLMADALEGMPILGGSAGDDLKFKTTFVFHGGEAIPGGAVFAVADSDVPFEIVKHQHYTTTPRQLVITRADLPARRVYEMDGYPALEAYARTLGLTPEEVTGDVTFMNPLTFVCDGQIYVRSIQRVEPDGSMIFYCGIEEGMVLSVGGHEEMPHALDRDISKTRMKKPDLFIACNCILRALEASKREQAPALGGILANYANSVIGFDTYGEQLNGLHINQTLVGIALRGAEEAQ